MSTTARTPRSLAPDPTRSRRNVALLALLPFVLVSMVLTVGIGGVAIPADQTAAILWSHLAGGTPAADGSADLIVWQLRFPRVLLGAIVGAGLAASGAGLQAIVRNPLADPFLLGISSGATTGAAAAILLGFGASLGVSGLTGSAFLGALGAIALVLAVARVGGRVAVDRLVFAGITVGFALTAVTNFVVFASDSRDGVRAVMFWTLGSLAQSSWTSLPLAAGITGAGLAVLMLWARRFDAIAIGDDTALALGTDPTRFRALAAATIAVMVAAGVAVSGLIGFVGLVVPHLARRMVGHRHDALLPVSALTGAGLLVWADALARVAFAPRELPLGILTALIGTPLLLLLVHRSRR
ncbi:MAG: iron ABC transporter permease [Arachnia sp.]